MEIELCKYGKIQVLIAMVFFGICGVYSGYEIITNYSKDSSWIMVFIIMIIVDAWLWVRLQETCFKWIMDKEGCTFVFLKRTVRYSWEKLDTRWRKKHPERKNVEIFYVSAEDAFGSGEYYDKYSRNNPFANFYICFADKGTDIGGYRSRETLREHYVQSSLKKEIFEKLESWGVELVEWLFNKGKWVIFLFEIVLLLPIMVLGYQISKGMIGEDILIAILMCAACLLVDILVLISAFTNCKKWIIDSFGCTFVFPFCKKRYRWSELKTCWRKHDPEYPDIEIFYVSTRELFHSGKYYEKYRGKYPFDAFYICFAPSIAALPSTGSRYRVPRDLDTYVNSSYKEKFFNLLELSKMQKDGLMIRKNHFYIEEEGMFF